MSKKGFTLIELMIVVAIIAIIAAIAIPSLLNARRNSNESAAMATCKSFGSAAVDFSNSNPSNYFWSPDTDDSPAAAPNAFAPFFSHVSPKGGYNFKYFANGAVAPGNDSTRFVYFAYPVSTSSGRKAYFIDESQAIFEAVDLTTALITACGNLADADFTQEAGDALLMVIAGVTWNRK